MDGGQVQRDFCLRGIRIIQKLFLHHGVIQKNPLRRRPAGANANAGPRIQFVKLLQPIFVQQTENRLAAKAAEGFSVHGEGIIGTRFPAMAAAAGGAVCAGWLCMQFLRWLRHLLSVTGNKLNQAGLSD
jgi:hypothetical protein